MNAGGYTVTLTDDPVVLTLWWITLGITVLVVVPLAIHLLHRTFEAARMIQRYTAETLAAGLGIAGNTAPAGEALDATIAAAVPIVERMGRLRGAAAGLEAILLARGGSRAERGGAR